MALKCISPVDGTLYAVREALSLEAARQAVAKAHAGQAHWAARPLPERINLVQAAVDIIGQQNDDIVPELAWQMGRPVRYGGEFGGFQERASFMADIAPRSLAPIAIEDSNKFQRYIKRVPHGAVLVIAPWNYPFMTAINAVAPALIAGNVVLLKHATQTIVVGERLAEAFHQAGVPPDVFQNLYLDHATTGQLIADKSFGFVNFTGSVDGGRAIEQAAAGSFTGLGLELGGKDPGYVMHDADVELAAETLIDGAMFNSGQCCCGIERIYVADTLFEKFIEKAVSIVNGYRLGNPLDPDTTLGPMAHERFSALVRAQTDDAVSRGARALIDPAAFPANNGAYLMPQILIDVDHTMPVMREESFGPVVGIMKVKDDAEAIRLMNDSDYGLTAALWTRDLDRATLVADQLETGTVFMNRCDYLDPALCWTGCKDTGRGGSLSEIGFHNLTRPKSYHMKKGG
ncbi:MAG TPA: aldehyde dehydrogenase [Rhodobacteraceae bacterium]|nr:aldehyde dehydrogenase [Paracoccaceae bacterium]